MSEDGMTVVLGWDGLDYELATELDVADAFGSHTRRIDTFDNEAIGKPHTAELWPSIITGQHPDGHGIYAAGESGAVDWDSSIIHKTAKAAQYVIPEGIRKRVGAWLRSRGAEMTQRSPAYYEERDIETVFDDRNSLPLALPNYRTVADQRYGILADRGAQLAQVLDWDSSGEDGRCHEPGIPIHEFDQLLVGELHKKLGVVREAIQRDYDLVFVWLGYLDSVGHVAPVVDETGYQARAYAQASKWTREVASDLRPEDTLITVSDHGLRDGYHTHDAFLGASEPGITSGTTSVLDVADAIDRVTPRNSARQPTVRDAYTTATTEAASGAGRSVEGVRDQLADLGYI